MASVNVSLQQLCEHGVTPEEMLAYVEEVDAIGLKLHMQAKHPRELHLLKQMATRKRVKQRLGERRQLLSLIALGSLGALGSIVLGLSML